MYLVGLALLSSSLLLLLGLGNGGITLGLAKLGRHVLALLDQVKRSTNDGTLGLDGLAVPALGDLLNLALTVVATVEGGPGDLTGVLALGKERRRFGREETENLRISTDKELAAAGVDLATAERINLNLHYALLSKRQSLWKINIQGLGRRGEVEARVWAIHVMAERRAREVGRITHVIKKALSPS